MKTALKEYWPRNLKSKDTFTSVHRLIATIAMETIAFDVRVAMVDKSLGNGAGASNLPADCHYSRMVCGMNHERPRRHLRYTNVYHGATYHRKKIWSFIRAEGLSRSAEQQFVVMWAAGILHIPRMLAIRACWWRHVRIRASTRSYVHEQATSSPTQVHNEIYIQGVKKNEM